MTVALAPHVIASLVPLLHQVEERWPDLRGDDLPGAVVLVEALEPEAEGRA